MDESVTKEQLLRTGAGVPVQKLVGLFRNTTNSYKYLFFYSLLRIIQGRHNDPSPVISLDEIITEMLTLAWYPYQYFKLSFGPQDQVSKVVDRIPPPPGRVRMTNSRARDEIRRHIAENRPEKESWDLMKYVPFRLIRPFFGERTRGLAEGKVHSTVKRLALERFAEDMPFYYIDDEERHIILHHRWMNFFLFHYSLVEEWFLWEWLHYMQKRNPSVPNLPLKLQPPQVRDPLNKEREYWKAFMEESGVTLRCAYSGEPLGPDNFELDHVLPWSFVAHNRIWNLVPALPGINGAKSDRLPDEARYLEGISRIHQDFVRAMEKRMRPSDWRRFSEPYLTDLRIPSYQVLNGSSCGGRDFPELYQQGVRPLFALAASQGFSANWVWG